MFVCHCRAVNDRRVAATIAAGARTLDEVTLRCGAGSRCGGCWPTLRALLDQYGPARDDAARHHAA